MKKVNFSILVCILSFMLFGCQTDQKLGKPSLEPLGPTGFCEAVSKKYRFRFEKEPKIKSILALVRRNRVVVILGNSEGYTVAFLIRSVQTAPQTRTLRKVETFTLSFPTRVLKLEQLATEAEGIKLINNKYAAFVSYDKQNWIPLSEAKLTQKELSRDIALMERTWKDAQRIAVVDQCKDYNEVSQKRSFKSSNNCGISDDACNTVWMLSLDDVFADRDAEFADPPFGIGPDDDSETGWLAGRDVGGGGGSDRDCWDTGIGDRVHCPGSRKVSGFGADEERWLARATAVAHARRTCGDDVFKNLKEKCCDFSAGSEHDTWFACTVKGCCIDMGATDNFPPVAGDSSSFLIGGIKP